MKPYQIVYWTAIVLLFVCAPNCIFIAIVLTVHYFFNFCRRCETLTRFAIVLVLYCYCNSLVSLLDSSGIGNQIKSNAIRIQIKPHMDPTADLKLLGVMSKIS